LTTPNPLERLLHDLVIANRILAHEGVLDAYGHVSVRNPLRPDHFFLSRSRSPELVTREDIMEFDYAGNPTPGDTRPPYLERFIHGGIYEARPDIHAVVHSHADEVLPFTIANRVLQPVIHTASDMGSRVSVWDIRDKFGDTNMLVVNPEQGRDLAQCLGPDRVVLMRGHGFAAGAPSLFQVVKTAVYLPLNARTLKEGLQLGEVKTLSPGEVAARATTDPDAPASRRAWEYWCRRINMTPYWEL
jgi:HCOMODA/2-hydroxy-3-carboxy-muconic semialdehyde decarboxylase